MPLSVSLISGKSVLELPTFIGNGLELREKVGKELRLTPSRLRLVTAPDNQEINNEQSLDLEGQELTSVTAMVGEGKELPEWCREEMPHYSFKEVEDALDLPNDAIEVGPLIVGKVMMLQIAKVKADVNRDYSKFLKDHDCEARVAGHFCWDLDQDELDEDYILDISVGDGVKALELFKPKWLETKAKLRKVEEAAYSFAALDDRIKTSRNIFFYSRWQEHEEKGVKKRHRVYGVRHEFAAVEFEKVLDRWLEKEGRFDKLAAKSLRNLWETRITTVISVSQRFSTSFTVERVRAFCSILLHALEDPNNAQTAWIGSQVETAKATLTMAFNKATFILRENSGWRHVFESLDESKEAVEGLAAAWMMTARDSDSLQDGLLNALLELADERREEPRAFGAKMLMAYFPKDPRTMEKLGECAKHDWPHARQKLTSFLNEAPSPESCLQHYVTMEPVPADELPSPRTLVMTSMRGKPIRLPAIHKSPRRRARRRMRGMRNRDEHREMKHVLYEVGSDESDEDDSEVEEEE